MKIRVYWLKDCELEVLNISHETLEKSARYFSEGVYGLDVHCTNQHTSLLDLGNVDAGDVGRQETAMILRPSTEVTAEQLQD